MRAVLLDTYVTYAETDNQRVIIQKGDGRWKSISVDTFDILYHKLNRAFAALKSDCIECVIHDDSKPLFSYPEWYIQMVYNNLIYNVDGVYYYYDYEADSEVVITHGCIFLRNYLGDITYMDRETFNKYYNLMEG